MNPELSPSDSAPSRVFLEATPSTLISPAVTPAESVALSAESVALSAESVALPSESVALPSESVALSAESAALPSESAALSAESAALPAESAALPDSEPAALPAESEKPENAALALTFSPAPDAPFQSSVSVAVACATPGARVFYATGGVDVDEEGLLWAPTEKILLTESTTLAARAFLGGERGPLLRARFEVKKALWQEKEPADPTDSVPHKISENLATPDAWRIGAASVRGKLHAHRALWREDAFTLGNIETSGGAWSAILVSDGAGSAPLSRIGSQAACASALESLRATLGALETLGDDENALKSDDLPRLRAALVAAASAALEAIRQQSQTRAQPLSAFAATLLILVRRPWKSAQLCGAIQIGDGAIALHCESGLKLLGEADHGQHSSETRFLTTSGIEAEFPARVKFSLPADLKAVLLVSDGVSDDYFPENPRLGEVFDAVLPLAHGAPDAGNALLDWLGYEKKGSSDDRTLVLSWPAPLETAAFASQSEDTNVETNAAASSVTLPATKAAMSQTHPPALRCESTISPTEAATLENGAASPPTTPATLENGAASPSTTPALPPTGAASLQSMSAMSRNEAALLSTTPAPPPTGAASLQSVPAMSQAGAASLQVAPAMSRSEAVSASARLAMPENGAVAGKIGGAAADSTPAQQEPHDGE